MEFKDYYKDLGVGRGATADEIKKAYRKLARKYHPDVSKETDAQGRMQKVNEAYAVLSDPEKRTAYDALGKRYQAGSAFEPPPNWDAGFEFSGGGPQGADFSDFFESLFGRGERASGGRARRATRGEDHHARIEIDLADAYDGAERAVTLRGARLGEDGNVVADERTLRVRIPKGVREGQHIRLSGQGTQGRGDGPPGDLYLEVRFANHPSYRIEGRDVTQAVPVAPWEAMLGASIEVPTPSGRLNVNVPPGSRNGTRLRLKGRGIPGDPPGDLYMELELVLPPDSPRARELFSAMARELSFDPRQATKA